MIKINVMFPGTYWIKECHLPYSHFNMYEFQVQNRGICYNIDFGK